MIYLLDANTLIEAKNRYYRMKVCPAYWSWIQRSRHAGLVARRASTRSSCSAGRMRASCWPTDATPHNTTMLIGAHHRPAPGPLIPRARIQQGCSLFKSRSVRSEPAP